VLISKVIQNLANDTAFKEPYMLVLNDWMQRNRPRMLEFLDKMSSGEPPAPQLGTFTPAQLEIDFEDYRALIGFLTRLMPKMEKWAIDRGKLKDLLYLPFDQLKAILKEIDEVERIIIAIMEKNKAADSDDELDES